jgi:hypothetical protein
MVGYNCALYGCLISRTHEFAIPGAADAEQEEECSRRMASNSFKD